MRLLSAGLFAGTLLYLKGVLGTLALWADGILLVALALDTIWYQE